MDYLNPPGSHPMPRAIMIGTPTKKNPRKAKIQFLPAVTPQSLSDTVTQKHNHPHIQRSSTFRGKLPYLQMLHIFTELHFNTVSYIKPEQNQNNTFTLKTPSKQEKFYHL